MSTELSDAAGHPTFCTAPHYKGHSHSAEETCEGMWNKDEGDFLQTIILQIFYLQSTNLQYNMEVKYTGCSDGVSRKIKLCKWEENGSRNWIGECNIIQVCRVGLDHANIGRIN